MPVTESSTLVLNAEDRTGRAIASAAANVKKLAEQSDKTAKQAAKDAEIIARYSERAGHRASTAMDRFLLGTSRRFREWGETAAEAHRKHTRALDQSSRSMGDASSALAGVAGRYLSVAAAAEVARRSFLGFANLDMQLRRMQNQAGATDAEVQHLKNTLQTISRESGQSVTELAEGFHELREAAKMSFAEAEPIFPRIAKAAQNMNVTTKELAIVYGDMMRNLGLSASDVTKTMDMLNMAQNDFRLNIEGTLQYMPGLTSAMERWGITGIDGLKTMLAVLGRFREATGDTGRAAMALMRMFEQMGDDSMGQKLGYPVGMLRKELERARAEGKNVLGVYISILKEAEARGVDLDELFGIRVRGGMRKLLGDIGDVRNKMNALDNSIGTVDRDAANLAKSPKMAVDQLVASFSELFDIIGKTLDALGVTTGVQTLSAVMNALADAINKAKDAAAALQKIMPGGLNLMNLLQSPGGELARSLSRLLGVGGGTDKIDEETKKKSTEELRKFKEEVGEATRLLKKMSWTLDGDGGGGGRVWRASLGGSGGGYGGGGGNWGGSAPQGAYGGPGGPGHGAGGGLGAGGAGAGGGAGLLGTGLGPGAAVPSGVMPAGLGTALGEGLGAGGLGGSGVLSGGGPGAGAGSINGSGLNRAAYEQMFAGTPLAGKYDKVVEEAQKNGIDPSLMAAVMAHETGKGTSNMLRNRNNPAGLMDPKTGMSTGQNFPNLDAGIESAGRTIAKNWNRGGNTIEGMGRRYAPVGAANDPRGLNSGWAAGVSKYQRQLSAGASNDPGSSSGVPTNILARAREVASSGGPGAVAQFMASQGYPKSGAWCGQFAASVVKSTGGVPPKNPQVASNWRNWGTPVDSPQPGDIAVRNRSRFGGYTPTGATGSHVTIVDSVGQGGTFTGLGGNQSRWKSQYNQEGWQFRRGRGSGESGQQTESGPSHGWARQQNKSWPNQGQAPDVRDAMRTRQELEKPIRLNLDTGGPAVGFQRASMRREADRELRESRHNSYSDIGAA